MFSYLLFQGRFLASALYRSSIGKLMLALPGLLISGSIYANNTHTLPGQLFVGINHTCAITDDGKMKCWGENRYGQLGLGDSNHRGDEPNEMGEKLPLVDLGTNVVPVSAVLGHSHTCTLLSDGQVKCWGANHQGQLGQGHTRDLGDEPNEMGDSLPFVDLGPNTKVSVLVAGRGHTCALLDNGGVKCWGDNFGKLGLGYINHMGDQPNEMGVNLPLVNLDRSFTVKHIAAGGRHTCVLSQRNEVKCWGDNDQGQLGQGDTNIRGDEPNEMGFHLNPINFQYGMKPIAITLGDSHTCALFVQTLDLDDPMRQKVVMCWGANFFGQLGAGDRSNRGNHDMNNLRPIFFYLEEAEGSEPIPLHINKVSAGSDHTCVLLSDNQVRCWGRNIFGQLGQGNGLDLGDDYFDEIPRIPPINLGDNLTVRSMVTGGSHNCVLLSDDKVKCWGNGFFGQLGLGQISERGRRPEEMGNHLPIVELALGTVQVTVAAAGAGGSHTCALLTNGQVKCWGGNHSGQLGLGDDNIRGDGRNEAGDRIDEMGENLPTVQLGDHLSAIEITAGRDFTCTLLSNNKVKCWGAGHQGQLGHGKRSGLGTESNQMGNNLPYVNLGTNLTTTSIQAGSGHVCALLSNEQLKCWGYNIHGQLGQGDTNNRGDNQEEMGNNLPPINLGIGPRGVPLLVKSFSVGSGHTCAILSNNQLKCWGENIFGQLGLGDTENRGRAFWQMGDDLPAVDFGDDRDHLFLFAQTISAGSNHTCALLNDGNLKCWGHNYFGQLGQDNRLNKGEQRDDVRNLRPVNLGFDFRAYQVLTGSDFTCAVSSRHSEGGTEYSEPDNELKCWGRNDFGQLGLGDANHQGDEFNEMDRLPIVPVGQPPFSAIVLGYAHTCAVINGGIKCWGANHYGQLGQNDIETRGDQRNEVRLLPEIDLGL